MALRTLLGLSLLALASTGCGEADAAARQLSRPSAFVDTGDEWSPLGPLAPGENRLVLPLTARSERVPRPEPQRRGALHVASLALCSGPDGLKVRSAEAHVVRHRMDERVLLVDGEPRLFGPAVLPVRTDPPRALAALARQDGVAWIEPATLEAPRSAGPLVQVLAEAETPPTHALVAPADATRTAPNVDQAAFRAERALELLPTRALAGRALEVESVDLARWRGLGPTRELVRLQPLDGATADGPFELEPREARELSFVIADGPSSGEADETLTLIVHIVVEEGAAAGMVEAAASTDDSWFVDIADRAVAGESGPLLAHFEGPAEQLDIRPTMGPGAAWGDFDGDGWVDLYLLQGAGREGSDAPRNRLLRNRGRGAEPPFEDVTEAAGVGDTGAGMGALFVDLDGDRDLDLYVANYGRDVLYINRGDGTFADASSALPDLDLWSAGVAAADGDGDGDLDLYVTSYLDYDPALMPDVAELERYQREDPTEMLPFAFPGQRNVYLRNDGTPQGASAPTFVDATDALGLLDVQGRGMQAVFWDFDRDVDQDLYVANDVSFNVLFQSEGDGSYVDVSFSTGLDDPRGGMGLAVGDVDRDGDEDLFLTNWQLEANALYVNRLYGGFEKRTRRASFHDATVHAGLGRSGVGSTSWGAVLFDLELDGDLDLFVANGYTSPDYQGTGICVGQPNHLFIGDGHGRFEEAHDLAAPALSPWLASRGAVGCDYDRDGDVDLVVTANNGPAQLLQNRAPRRGDWLGVRLAQPGPNPFAIGAEVTVHVERDGHEELQRRSLRAGEGYLTAAAPELHFGLGKLGDTARVTRVVVRWPDGEEQDFAPPPVGAWTTLERD